MKHIVLLTKPYFINDFEEWYKYHKAMGWTVHVINNRVDMPLDLEMDLEHGDTYEKLDGWPNQWKLFSDILNENRYGFKEGEYIAFIDDDEYLWFYMDYWKKVEEHDPKFEGKQYQSLENFLDEQLFSMKDNNTDVVLVPQTLMSTPFLHSQRPSPLIDFSLFRRDDASAQGKAIVKYHEHYSYNFDHNMGEKGHVPAIVTDDKYIRESVVNGTAISKTTYGAVDHNACLRLYHYHIKSRYDWELKYKRGSAAVDHQWYERNIFANKNFGGYIIPDFTMLETKKLYEL